MSLIAQWKLENQTGLIATPTVGPTGTISRDASGLWVGSGQGPGGSLSNAGFNFNRNLQDDISLSNLGIGSTGTFSAWIKTSAPIPTGMAIIDAREAGFDGYLLYVDATISGTAALAVNSDAAKSTGLLVNDGNWHHILASYDRSASTPQVKLYIDNNLVSTANSTTIISTPTGISKISARSYSGPSLAFDGIISDIRVYDSDESSNVINIYNSAIPSGTISITGIQTVQSNLQTITTKNDNGASWQYQWYACDDNSGTNENLVGTGYSYTTSQSNVGKYIRCDGTLINISGAGLTGSTLSSNYIGPIINLKISDVVGTGKTSTEGALTLKIDPVPGNSGDLLVAISHGTVRNNSSLTTGGWTKWIDYYSSNTTTIDTTVYVKKHSGSESAFTQSTASDDTQIVSMYAISGGETGNYVLDPLNPGVDYTMSGLTLNNPNSLVFWNIISQDPITSNFTASFPQESYMDVVSEPSASSVHGKYQYTVKKVYPNTGIAAKPYINYLYYFQLKSLTFSVLSSSGSGAEPEESLSQGNANLIINNIQLNSNASFENQYPYVVSVTGSVKSDTGGNQLRYFPVSTHISGDLLLAFYLSTRQLDSGYTPTNWIVHTRNQGVNGDNICIFSKIGNGIETGILIRHDSSYYDTTVVVLSVRNQGEYSGCITYGSSYEQVTDGTKEVPIINVPVNNSLLLHGYFSNYTNTAPSLGAGYTVLRTIGNSHTIQIQKKDDVVPSGSSPPETFTSLDTWKTYVAFTMAISPSVYGVINGRGLYKINSISSCGLPIAATDLNGVLI